MFYKIKMLVLPNEFDSDFLYLHIGIENDQAEQEKEERTVSENNKIETGSQNVRTKNSRF